MSSTAEPAPPKKRLPPWLLTSGGPPEPNHAAFRAKMGKYADEKRALITEAKELRASLGPREGREEVEREREELRRRLGEIDGQRKAEQDLRFKKNEEIRGMQRKNEEHAAKLRDLSDDLCGLTSLKDIDDAIAYVTRKMETSGGGLAAEKRAARNLSRLEDAKKYILELQPLNEAIAEAKHREAVLQREWQEINERVRQLNGEYNEQRMARQQREQESCSAGVNRQEVFKKCDAISAKINAINESMNAAREEHNKAVEAWGVWCEEARLRYVAKMEAERKERERRYLERRDAAKLEEKRGRAARRQNPYEMEISACLTLARYLKDQKVMVQREAAERERLSAAAAFDPASHLPPGAVVLNDGKKWAAPGAAKKPKAQPKQQKKPQEEKNRVLQHSEEKVRLFHLVGEEPPLALAAIDAAVERMAAKQKEYAAHIRTGELELSSDEDEEEEVVEEKKDTAEAPAPEETAAA